MITLEEQDFFKLTEFMKEYCGINLESKRHLIEGRLCNFIAERGFSNFQDYFDYVLSLRSKEELAILINKLTTNHTFFMREEEHFDFFAKTVLPQLEKEVVSKDLRIWSAGCSSGEEPYTLAMIMQEFFAEKSAFWDKKILATDISEDVLRKAIRGVYLQESLENINSKWHLQFFRKINKEEVEVSDALKKEVIFRIFNLMNDFPFRKKFHVIFCRNVMIYFDKPTKDKLIHKFYDMTEKGGYLFIGLSESLDRDEFDYEYVMPSVYRKG